MTRLATALLLATLSLGCAKKPQYDRPLPPGGSALRELTDVMTWPDLRHAWQRRGPALLDSVTKSIGWFDKPSSMQFFPMEHVDHERAQASVVAFRHLLEDASSADEFELRMHREFNCFISVGWDQQGTVLYTGYYSPQFRATRRATDVFRYPLYRRPADLVTDPVTGKPLGQQVGDRLVSYPTRARIEQENLLAGGELVYLSDPLSAYIVHVNGSAKLILGGGEVMYVGYAGKTDRPYKGLGQMLLDDGKIAKGQLSLVALRRYFREHPDEVQKYIYRNQSYVFFTEYDGANWPSGSLGFQVTPQATLATDKSVFPRGGVVLVSTDIAHAGGSAVRFHTFMVDQDTGGAIRAPGRADIYMGMGPTAEQLAGDQYAEGKLFYFFLKPDRVPMWVERIKRSTPTPLAVFTKRPG